MENQGQPEKLDPKGLVQLPALAIPSFRTLYALQLGVERNLIMKTWGGLGDQICAEPTLRFALKSFQGCNVSLASEQPEFFAHLPFTDVFDLKRVQPIWEKYFPFDTIVPPDHITWQFMSHMLVNCVDFPSLCAFRCQIPIEERVVQLEPSPAHFGKFWREVAASDAINVAQPPKPLVAIHAGKHWQSKTFPKAWWDEVLTTIIGLDAIPVLIGGSADDNRTTVDVNPQGCVDLRGKLSLMESVAAVQAMPVLLTNDSAPLHMAVTGQAWVGFIATCKHPDYISHWRRPSPASKAEWSWRMQNHGKGGIWDVVDYCPNKPSKVEAENVGDTLLESWLPDPKDFGAWGVEKAREVGGLSARPA